MTGHNAKTINDIGVCLNKYAFKVGQKITDEDTERMSEMIYEDIIRKRIYHTADLSYDFLELVFRMGTDGIYGEVKRLNVKLIISWFEAQKRYENKKEDQDVKIQNEHSDEYYKAAGEKWGPYILWRLNTGVDPDDVDVDMYWKDVNSGTLKDLEEMYGGKLGTNFINKI